MTHTIDSEHKTIEELSLSHWQPLSTLLYDGWVLRFAKGYTKRANSVQPIYDSTLMCIKRLRNVSASMPPIS